MNDFNRIKRNSQFNLLSTSFTPQNNSMIINPNNESLNLKQMRSFELKKRIMEYDKAKKEEAQNAELERYTSIINQSRKEQQNGEESLRAMDKLILYAKVATIRDRQLEEKTKLIEEAKKKDKKLELMMEIERLKQLSHQEIKESELKKQKREGFKIIVDQIKDNERARSIKKELTQREDKEMVEYIKLIEEEERIKAEEAKKQSKRIYKESIKANQEAIEDKKLKLMKEKENDQKIFQYTKDKAQKEEEMIKEKKRLQEKKEHELQKLREAQERAKDQDEELNAIRARREYESTERKQREKIATAIAIKSRRLKDFLATNNQQRLDKEIQLAEQSKQERIFFEKIVDKQQKEIDEERKNKEEYRRKLYEHNHQLRRQIKEKEEKERIKQIEKYEEGMKIKNDNYNYIQHLEERKVEKIKELIDLNLNPSYFSDLKRYRINQI